MAVCLNHIQCRDTHHYTIPKWTALCVFCTLCYKMTASVCPLCKTFWTFVISEVVDSGGSRISRRGRRLTRGLHFKIVLCQHERIRTLRGRPPASPPPLDPAMGDICEQTDERYYTWYTELITKTNEIN